jgi:hypothetical protein
MDGREDEEKDGNTVSDVRQKIGIVESPKLRQMIGMMNRVLLKLNKG